jgi:methyl-accepting chemotaxis protein
MKQLFRNLKIGTRVMAGFIAMLFFVVATGTVSLVGTFRIHQATERSFSGAAKIAETSNTLYGSVINISRIEKDILMNVKNPSSRAEAVQSWQDETSSIQSRIGILSALMNDSGSAEESSFLNEAKNYAEGYISNFSAMFAQMEGNSFSSIDDAAAKSLEVRNDLKKLEFIVKGISTRAMTSLQQTREATENESRRIIILVSAIVVVSVFLGIVISILISSSIRRPLNLLTGRVKDIAEGEGDLTMKIAVANRDETGILSSLFNSFIDKIRDVIRETKEASSSLSSSSREMNLTTVGFSENIRDQAASSEEISSTLEEVSASVDSIASSISSQYEKIGTAVEHLGRLTESIQSIDSVIKKSRELSEEISTTTRDGMKSMDAMTASMAKITESSVKISGIISMITGISDQINLLSLNAAIEAARAGDAGKGFAVVADEISKLAEQTSESVKEIDTLVNLNKTETASGLKDVSSANEMIRSSIESITLISAQINEIFNLMRNQISIHQNVENEMSLLRTISDEINGAMSQQKTAFTEIMKSITQISERSQENAAAAQTLADISARIEQLSRTLDSKVGFFKV